MTNGTDPISFYLVRTTTRNREPINMQRAGRHSGKGVFAATALAKVMSGDMGELKLAIGKPGYNPHTNTLYLPGIPGDDLPEDALKLLRAYLQHEAAERGRSTWDPRDPRWFNKDPSKRKPGLKKLVNAINDARIDLSYEHDFPGAYLNIRWAVQRDIDELLVKNAAEPLKPSVNLVATLSRYVGEGLLTVDDLYREFPQLRKHLDKVQHLLRALDLTSEDRIIEQAIAIYRLLKKPGETPKPQPQPSKGTQDQQPPEQEDGEGDDAGESQDQSEAAQQQSKNSKNKPEHGREPDAKSESPNADEKGKQGKGQNNDEADEGEDDTEEHDGLDGEDDSDVPERSGGGGSGGEEEDEGEEDDEADEFSDEWDDGLDDFEEDGNSSNEGGSNASGGGNAGGGAHDDRGPASGQSGEHSHELGEPGEPPLDDEADTDHDTEQSMLDDIVDALFDGQQFHEHYGSEATTYTWDPTGDSVSVVNHRDGKPLSPSSYKAPAQVLETKLRQALTMPAPRMTRGRERGEVDERVLHKVPAGVSSVFRRRIVQEADSVAASLSWDESGSMGGVFGPGSIDVVKTLAYVFNEALGRLGIPTEMLGWTTGGYVANPNVYRRNTARHRIYKEFKDAYTDPKVLARLGKMAASGSTPTAEGLRVALERLGARPEKRKVLFFLTDGRPEMSVNGPKQVHEEYIFTLLERAERAGIEVVGVGIKADVSKYFTRSVHVNNITDIRARVADELVKVLREGKRLVLAGKA